MEAKEHLSLTNRRWRLRREAPAPGELGALYGPLVAELLAARGVLTSGEAEHFLDPGLHRLSDPFALQGVEAAVDRIARALDRGERIAVYGDYDVDGQSSTALMVRLLRSFGAAVQPYIPNRLDEGYGLHQEALEALAGAGCSLVITVDCGIAAFEEAEWAARSGLDLIITDHHEPQERLPRAAAVINPHLDAGYPHPYLAGCGVAFKLAEALATRLAGDRSVAHRYVELVALGTVADVVPLRGENRSLVRAGLLKMSGASEIPGIEALRRAAGAGGEVTAGEIAFLLGPRLNAAGRVGDPTLGLRLLLAESVEEATPIALELDACNARRRRIEEEVLSAALLQVEEVHRLAEDRGLVVAGEGWHEGVVGIAASRLVDAFHRPALVIAIEEGVGRGSGRSIPGFDLFAALSECAELFDAFGGHAAAAGFTLAAERIGLLRERFLAVTRERLGPEDLVPELAFDAYIDLDGMNFELLQAIESLEPFGEANPAPLFVSRGVRLSGRAVGKDASHLKLTVSDPESGTAFDGIAFSMAPLADRLEAGRLYDIAFVPEVNVWNGRRSLQLRVKDVRPASESAGEATFRLARARGTLEAAAALDEPVGGALSGEWTRRIRVEEARGRSPGQLLDELLSEGWFAYVVPGPNRRALEAGERLMEGSRLARDRAFYWAPPLSEEERRLVERALKERPWAVVARIPPPRSEVEEWQKRGLAGSGLAVLLCDLPEAPGELLGHLFSAAAWNGPLRCLLAFGRQEVEKAEEELFQVYPDRERLAVVYASLRAFKSRGATPEELHRAIERLRPGAVVPEGVAFGLAVFEELGLVENAGGRWRLRAEAPAKVDLEDSLRYNEGNVRRIEFSSYAQALLSCTPGDFLTTLLGRGADDGFEGAGA